jgi:membrane protease YdiL (CAAX protease family)
MARLDGQHAWVQAGLIAVGLTAVVVARWTTTRAGFPALAVGAGFGLALLALVAGARRTTAPFEERRVRWGWITVAGVLGLAVGLALVATALAAPALAGVPRVQGLARPAAPFGPWAVVTIVVATAEEAILRGVLFGAVRRASGTMAALGLTTLAFALMHVPMYGWHVVPLDLAVGFTLGGLRIATRGIAAPAVAHAIADLATWWL